MREKGTVSWDHVCTAAPVQDIHGRVAPQEVELVRRDYCANAGWETFLSYEDPRQDILIGLLRLRRLPAGRGSIVRELHVYGAAVAVHARDASKHQHQARARPLATNLCSPFDASLQDPHPVSLLHCWALLLTLYCSISARWGAGCRQGACAELPCLSDLTGGFFFKMQSWVRCWRRLGQGYGTLLLEEAEWIAMAEHRSARMAIISGVGTRHYYRKLGYRLEGPYMVKELPRAVRRHAAGRGTHGSA